MNPTHESEASRAEEETVMRCMASLELVDVRGGEPDWAWLHGEISAFDAVMRTRGKEVAIELKVRDLLSTRFPTVRLSVGKVEEANWCATKPRIPCRLIVQYLDRCVSIAIPTRTAGLQLDDGRRRDRPGEVAPCVLVPTAAAKTLWYGTVVDRQLGVSGSKPFRAAR